MYTVHIFLRRLVCFKIVILVHVVLLLTILFCLSTTIIKVSSHFNVMPYLLLFGFFWGFFFYNFSCNRNSLQNKKSLCIFLLSVCYTKYKPCSEMYLKLTLHLLNSPSTQLVWFFSPFIKSNRETN
jgi:hypothetical protein